MCEENTLSVPNSWSEGKRPLVCTKSSQSPGLCRSSSRPRERGDFCTDANNRIPQRVKRQETLKNLVAYLAFAPPPIGRHPHLHFPLLTPLLANFCKNCEYNCDLLRLVSTWDFPQHRRYPRTSTTKESVAAATRLSSSHDRQSLAGEPARDDTRRNEVRRDLPSAICATMGAM